LATEAAVCSLRSDATARGPRALITDPLYINENKSDMRGIKPGWYAMDGDGKLVSGPFSSREKCVEGNYHATNGINAVRSVLTAK
jgi:hypothetical protein